MYTIIVYDANTKRVHKYLKLLRRYLYHTQNSVFEGFITYHNLTNLKKSLKKINKNNDDSIIIFTFQNSKYIKRTTLGKASQLQSNII